MATQALELEPRYVHAMHHGFVLVSHSSPWRPRACHHRRYNLRGTVAKGMYNKVQMAANESASMSDILVSPVSNRYTRDGDRQQRIHMYYSEEVKQYNGNTYWILVAL